MKKIDWQILISGIFLGFMIGLVLVGNIMKNKPIESEIEIKPKIQVECVDGNCDTTYIYIRKNAQN